MLPLMGECDIFIELLVAGEYSHIPKSISNSNSAIVLLALLLRKSDSTSIC
jgi:hypothetical protein